MRRFPSELEQRAVARGADELMNLAEYHFAKRPRLVRRLRQAYRRLCVEIYRALERRWQK